MVVVHRKHLGHLSQSTVVIVRLVIVFFSTTGRLKGQFGEAKHAGLIFAMVFVKQLH